MSDNKKQVGKPDRDRISVSEKYEVEDWSKKFGVTSNGCSSFTSGLQTIFCYSQQ